MPEYRLKSFYRISSVHNQLATLVQTLVCNISFLQQKLQVLYIKRKSVHNLEINTIMSEIKFGKVLTGMKVGKGAGDKGE